MSENFDNDEKAQQIAPANAGGAWWFQSDPGGPAWLRSTFGNMTRTSPPVFFFADTVVGQFSSGGYPAGDGDVAYAPFRGPGHFQMQTALKQTGSAECYFKRGEQRVFFRVVECPKYGMLRIRASVSPHYLHFRSVLVRAPTSHN